MSRGRPRHQSSRRRMYSPRQRDVRERRFHERSDDRLQIDSTAAIETDDAAEFESPPAWNVRLHARASAA